MTNGQIADMRDKAKMGCTTVETMQEFVITSCDLLDKRREMEKESVLSSVSKLEDFLANKRENTPVEIKAAMEWGALWVANGTNHIDFDTMQKMFGEFMSKQMGFG